MASSVPVAPGDTILASDFNSLRSDILTGHTHDGTEGSLVAFSDLDIAGAGGSTAPAGGDSSYNDIDDHVQSSQGQHGMHSSVYIVGSNVGNMLIQAGTDTLASGTKTVTFSLAYTSTPIVVATYAEARTDIGNPSEASDIYIDSVTTSQVVVKTSDSSQWGDKSFNWMAIGIKTP